MLRGGAKRDREKPRLTLEDFRNMYRSVSERAQIYWGTQLDKNSFPFLQDQFVIVDGILWFFNSMASGGHTGLTAVNGPWSEDDTDGWRFFDDCWRMLNA